MTPGTDESRPAPGRAAAAWKPEKSDVRWWRGLNANPTHSPDYKDHWVFLGLIGIGVTVSLIGCFIPMPRIWLVILPLLMMTSFVDWLRYYRKWRAIEDTPTSNIASAAQGYVELVGIVAPAPGSELLGRCTRAPCVWYHYEIHEIINPRDSKLIETGSNSVPFIIRDDTGECLVHPGKAEVICSAAEVTRKGDRRYIEWSIRVGDPIHALGQFRSDATRISGDLDKESNAVLRSWLADPKAFFTRFDANRDGKMAAAELVKARDAARAAAAQRLIDRGGLNTLTAPPDGDGRMFYLVNAKDEHPVAALYSRISKENLWTFFISLAFLTWNLS